MPSSSRTRTVGRSSELPRRYTAEGTRFHRAVLHQPVLGIFDLSQSLDMHHTAFYNFVVCLRMLISAASIFINLVMEDKVLCVEGAHTFKLAFEANQEVHSECRLEFVSCAGGCDAPFPCNQASSWRERPVAQRWSCPLREANWLHSPRCWAAAAQTLICGRPTVSQ